MITNPRRELRYHSLRGGGGVNGTAPFNSHFTGGVQGYEGVKRVFVIVGAAFGVDIGGTVDDKVMNAVALAVTVVVVVAHENGDYFCRGRKRVPGVATLPAATPGFLRKTLRCII